MSLAAGLTSRLQSPGGAISVDLSDIVALTAMLGKAAVAAPLKADAILDSEVPKVHAAAVSNALAFHKRSTGELASVTAYDTSGNSRRVYAPVKQAAFLEYGTPNTGAPNPWMTGPAEAGSRRILTQMAEAGEIW